MNSLFYEIKWVRKKINDGIEALTKKIQTRFQISKVLCSASLASDLIIWKRAWDVHVSAATSSQILLIWSGF